MPGKIVTINSYENPAEAHAAKNLLENEGITAYVADEAIGNWLGYMGSAIGGIKLQVAETDAELSLAVLSGDEAGATGSESDDPWQCSRCREIVDAGFDVCWSCGGSREEFADPSFDPRQADVTEDTDDDGDTWDEDDEGAERPEAVGEIVDGQPNPYYAGSLPARSAVPRDMRAPQASEEMEAMVTRAWRASILGIFICPMFLLLNMYSVWLLLRVTASGEQLSTGGTWKYRMAWVVNSLAVFLFLLIFSVVLDEV